MKDIKGLYYLPSLQDKDVRMYVRESDGIIEFRLWNAENAEVWEKHEWLPYAVILQAAEVFKERGSDRNPLALYKLDIAKRLLEDDKL